MEASACQLRSVQFQSDRLGFRSSISDLNLVQFKLPTRRVGNGRLRLVSAAATTGTGTGSTSASDSTNALTIKPIYVPTPANRPLRTPHSG